MGCFVFLKVGPLASASPVDFGSQRALYLHAATRVSRIEALATLVALHSQRKAELCAWYLRLVDDRTEQWLASHFGPSSFHIDALPHDYLSVAPRDRDAVTRSLVTIRSALSAGGAVRRALAEQLADPLRREIYAALTRFCHELRAALSNVLAAFAVDDVTALAARPDVRPESVALVRACMGDIAHFQDMQLLEVQVWQELTGQADATRKTQRSDTVPVTSLVFTKLRSLESMFATALEHHFR
jgi:hypothetical protein